MAFKRTQFPPNKLNNETYADDGISAAEMNTPKACVVVGRNLVGHINRSTQVTAKLKECQRILQQMHALNNNKAVAALQAIADVDTYEINGRERAVILFQDVVTRWWSTHRMIKRLLRLKPALDFLFENEAHQIDCK